MRYMLLALVVCLLLTTPALAVETGAAAAPTPPTWVLSPAATLAVGLSLSACALAGKMLNRNSTALLYCVFGFLMLTAVMFLYSYRVHGGFAAAVAAQQRT